MGRFIILLFYNEVPILGNSNIKRNDNIIDIIVFLIVRNCDHRFIHLSMILIGFNA